MSPMRKRTLLVLVLALGLLAAATIFLFEETRQLSGVVRDSETHEPIPGASVTLATRQAVSDAQGEYSLAMPRGTETITVTADGYAPAEAKVNGDALFAHSFSVDLTLSPNLVTGVVRDAENKQPLPNVQVLVGDKTVAANGQGLFQVRAVKRGVPISAQVPGYEPLAGQYAGEGDVALNLTPNAVAVTVVDKYTNQPVSKAKIEQGGAQAFTDASGRAVAHRIKPGLPITATAPGFAAGSAPFAGADVRIALRPNTLDGSVVDATTNKPVSGTLVYLGDTFVQTGADGRYHLDNVPEQGAITVKAPGYRKTQVDVSGTNQRDVKLAPFLVHGIHIPFGLPADQVRGLMAMVKKTELNAIVITVKPEKGRLAWESQVPLAKEIGAPQVRGIDLHEVVTWCKAENIYCIARLAVFWDEQLANARPSLAIHNEDGTTYSAGGAAWANPFKTEVWDYDIALAKEIAALGFDEIQFDYVRFPGEIDGLTFGTDNTQAARVAAITGFLARAQKELRPTGVYLSADVLGLTTATNDDQGIGQRLQDLGPYLDYVSPMVYPDRWEGASYLVSKGLGIQDCTDALQCPYDVIYNSLKHAEEKTKTKVRLWLQAYPGPADYGVKEYRLQRKAAIDAGSVGWMFWNNAGTYDIKTFDPPQK